MALPGGSDWSSIRQAGRDGKPHESEHDPLSEPGSYGEGN